MLRTINMCSACMLQSRVPCTGCTKLRGLQHELSLGLARAQTCNYRSDVNLCSQLPSLSVALSGSWNRHGQSPSDPHCKYNVSEHEKGHTCLSATLCCVNRFRLAGEAEAEAQQRNQHLQTHMLQLQQQLKDQDCVLAGTKKQVFLL